MYLATDWTEQKKKKCGLKDMSKKIKDNETRRMKFLKRMRYEKYCERI